jgi:hypothetical protein
MTDVVARAADLFASPRARRRAAAESSFAPQALVLGGPPVTALGAALAGELRALRRSPAALLMVWAPGAAGPAPLAATPAARSLAARLARRQLPAVARGRLAWLPLDDEPGEALAAAVRAAAAVDVPVVVALAGARPRQAESVLGEFDLIVVAEPEEDAGAAALAVADLDAAGVGAVRCAPPRGAARLLALAGWGRLRGAAEIRDLAAAFA